MTRGDARRVGPTLQQLAQAELEPEREHQQDDAELGERLDDLRVGDERDRDVRPDDQPGEHVAEHDRLAQALEQDGRDRRDAQHHRQGAQELVAGLHGAVGSTLRQLPTAGRRAPAGLTSFDSAGELTAPRWLKLTPERSNDSFAVGTLSPV